MPVAPFSSRTLCTGGPADRRALRLRLVPALVVPALRAAGPVVLPPPGDAQGRSAEIGLAGDPGRSLKEDLGLVRSSTPTPLPGERPLRAQLEADALAAPQGRAEDVSLKGVWRLSQRVELDLRYRCSRAGQTATRSTRSPSSTTPWRRAGALLNGAGRQRTGTKRGSPARAVPPRAFRSGRWRISSRCRPALPSPPRALPSPMPSGRSALIYANEGFERVTGYSVARRSAGTAGSAGPAPIRRRLPRSAPPSPRSASASSRS